MVNIKNISFLLIILFSITVRVYSQTTNDSAKTASIVKPKTVVAEFIKKETLLAQGEIVSNVLKVSNNTGNKIKFRLSLDYPTGWRLLNKSDKIYELNNNDSLFFPIRILPTAQIFGNTRFMIPVYLISEEDVQLANTFFWSFTEKKTSWLLSVEPSSKRYFKNGSNTTNFKVNVLNTGTETQPVSLTLNNTSLYAILSDSSDRPLKNPSYNINLKPFQDTSFTFNFKYFQGTRNFNRIDIENHKPDNQNEEKTFSVFVNTNEPNLGGGNGFQSGQKVTFTRLSSEKTVNQFSSASLPIVVDLNINNIMNDVTFTTLNVRGLGQINKDQMLMYNFQTTTSTNSNDNVLKNSMYYLGYYYDKGSVQAGFINGGMMGIQSYGRGLRSDYYITRRYKIGAFYINNTGVPGSTNAYAYGLNYEWKYFKQNTLNLEYGRSENTYTKTITDAYNTRGGFNFLKGQSVFINFSTTVVNSTDNNSTISNKVGYYGAFSYNGMFFKNKLNTNQSFGKSTKEYSNSNIERYYYNQSTRFNFNNKVGLVLVNGYNKINYSFTTPIDNYTQTNQLSLNISQKNASFQPQAFYNKFNYTQFSYESRGVGLSYNVFQPRENTRIATTIQTGYNKQFNTPNNEEKFFMMWSGFVFYRTFTINARYNMSPVNNQGSQSAINGDKTPQTFSASVQNQYLFSNTHFMLQTGANYYYNNVFNQHSAGLYPEFYYFTNDGWRFKVNFSYNLITGNVFNFSNQQLNTENPATYTNQNVYIGLGIRKEFGAPIPFVKKKNHDVAFKAFYDLNGNGIKDKNEQPIENIVIGLGGTEVISNDEGEASMLNYPGGVWPLMARSLEISESWFANIPDSVNVLKDRVVFIPFVRGVKIKGKVGIDRESIRVDASSPFDLSRIKINANGNKTFSTLTDFQGNFEFYLPYGNYIINMDENILGDKYKLAKNNFEIEVNRSVDGMFISYLIVERKRKIIKKSFTTPENHK
ncbi:MAG: hypothetical protein WCO54_01305 [Bacteroidota bacterium]